MSAAGGILVLLVSGLSGEPRFATAFHAAASAVHDAAAARWSVPDSNLVYLAEDPTMDPGRIDGRATREGIGAAFAALTRRSQAGDVVLVLLLGHGSGQGSDSRLSLPGPDATAADFAGWLSSLSGRTVVLVNAATGSGDFLPFLSGPGRVVVTATKSSTERNESVFGGHFARGLTSEAADADKDGRVTVMEAFAFAKREVARAYESKNTLLTEHAQIGDTALARVVAFGTAPASTDPRVTALIAARRGLELEVDALRRRKATMDLAEYDRELERLLVEIATKTAAIRSLEGRRP
jgi:uncharacterized caspase-like protein